tara:strand:+ start:631 stop:846 length:216 start_codon:yes stop_codon:yes gene_type:complete
VGVGVFVEVEVLLTVFDLVFVAVLEWVGVYVGVIVLVQVLVGVVDLVGLGAGGTDIGYLIITLPDPPQPVE